MLLQGRNMLSLTFSSLNSRFKRLFFALVITFGCCGLAHSHEGSDAESVNNTHIILGTTNEPESPLFKEAELILTEVFHDLGYTFELQSITGARSLYWANSGKIDGVAFRVASLDTVKYANLKRVETPIFEISQSVISREPMHVDGWSSMANNVIAYERGTRFIEEKLDLFEDAIMVSTSSQAMGLVQVGRADFTILNERTAQKILEANRQLLADLIINKPPLTQITLYPYINEEKYPGLADKVATVLANK